MSRGREMLLASPRYGNEIPHEEFLDRMRHDAPDLIHGIQHVQFIKCTYSDPRRDPWTLRFAVCYTYPDYAVRRALYERGQSITDRTGWYPLVWESA